ncbi:MAG TPA: hypothetical protein DCS28_03755 [Candidatus Moranbacteria bacterium]|nr:hypothetical protein [Candidatus Moranbacteria bacterium]HAT75126.1 hypothetical protein [Candidatus Moranbacteria bacterium]
MNYCQKNKLPTFVLIFSFLLFLVAPIFIVNAAGVVPCGNGLTDPCTICHFIVGFKNLIDWGRNILIALSITMMTIAGVMYIVSSGDPEMIKRAKSLAVNTVIGFSLMLGAWLIINTTFYVFSAKSSPVDSVEKYNLGLEAKSWDTFTCSTASSSTVVPTPPDTPPISVSCDTITFQTDKIKAQCTAGDASQELMSFISCMYQQLGNDPKAMMINSISDNNGGASCPTLYPNTKCQKDDALGCCHHDMNSCHYGGTNCKGKSYAIDINTTGGSTASASQIEAAVSKCGAKYEPHQGNHGHASVSGATISCGCDYALNAI